MEFITAKFRVKLNYSNVEWNDQGVRCWWLDDHFIMCSTFTNLQEHILDMLLENNQ